MFCQSTNWLIVSARENIRTTFQYNAVQYNNNNNNLNYDPSKKHAVELASFVKAEYVALDTVSTLTSGIVVCKIMLL